MPSEEMILNDSRFRGNPTIYHAMLFEILYIIFLRRQSVKTFAFVTSMQWQVSSNFDLAW